MGQARIPETKLDMLLIPPTYPSIKYTTKDNKSRPCHNQNSVSSEARPGPKKSFKKSDYILLKLQVQLCSKSHWKLLFFLTRNILQNFFH